MIIYKNLAIRKEKDNKKMIRNKFNNIIKLL